LEAWALGLHKGHNFNNSLLAREELAVSAATLSYFYEASKYGHHHN
jgi:hypothetical protein